MSCFFGILSLILSVAALHEGSQNVNIGANDRAVLRASSDEKRQAYAPSMTDFFHKQPYGVKGWAEQVKTATFWSTEPLPEQGFEGKDVEHKDGETMTGDWGKEFGPKGPQPHQAEKSEAPAKIKSGTLGVSAISAIALITMSAFFF